MEKKMYVIFDMDGVIVDSEVVYRKAFMHAARVLGLPEDIMKDVSRSITGVSITLERQIMAKAFENYEQYDPDKIYLVSREYFANAVEMGEIDLKPGVMQILYFLKDRNIPLGLASSSPKLTIYKILSKHKILHFFDSIVSGDMIEHGKPDPDIFFKCATELGISEEEYAKTFVIEDSYNGVRAAYVAGMKVLMVPDLLPPTEEMFQKAEVLSSLVEVEAWIAERL